MSRSQEFQNSVERPVNIIDSRFGLRHFFLNDNEKSSYMPYATPGRGENGESSN
jgi:hypothetical protein